MTPQEFLAQLSESIGRFERLTNFIEVPGYLSWAEGYALMSLAQEWPVEGDVVEVGSFKGKSTCYLAEGCRRSGRGMVFAVDHFMGSPEHQKGGHEETAEIVETGSTFPQFLANLDRYGLLRLVAPIKASSQAAARDFSASARMVFIDGDHSYEGTQTDFEAWFPHVRDRGLVCFHDYQNAHYLKGVTRFIDEHVSTRGDMVFLHRADSLMTFMKVEAA
jgi:predicted O-methyltransferase YrrM